MNDQFLRTLKDQTDLVALVGKYRTLKKSGRNYMCKSPFREERTPSFSVSPDKGVWYDFGLSEGGDALSFLQKVEHLSFREAVEALAQINGLKVPANFGTKSSPQDTEKKDRLKAIHTLATTYFQSQLQASDRAQAYLSQRGFSAETVSHWQLGYGGDTPNGFVQHAISQGFTAPEIESAGLAMTGNWSGATLRDRFSGRLVIPIRDSREGDIIAFTGRILDPKQKGPKYMNSPEHKLYHKSSTLFGLTFAKPAIRHQDHVVLVEGNFDVIAAQSAGTQQVVATCGTSLTEEHVRVLKRLTHNVIIAFDADTAGKKATLRAVDLLFQFGLQPSILRVPAPYKDLDDLVQGDPQSLQTLVKQAEPALLFLAHAAAKKWLDGSLQGQKKYTGQLFPYIALCPDVLEQDHVLEVMAKALGRPLPLIREAFAAHKQAQPQRHKKPKHVELETHNPEEQMAGFLSLHWPHLQPYWKPEYLHFFTNQEVQTLLQPLTQGHPLTEPQHIRLTALEMRQQEAPPKKAVETLTRWVESQERNHSRKSQSAAQLEAFYKLTQS